MKHFKDSNNNIYAYEADGSQDAYILPNLVAITEEEADAIRNPPPPPETPEQIIARLESAIDSHLDTIAHSYRYESIRTMVTYAFSDHPTFGAEGRAAVKWRDACYQRGIEVLGEVEREERAIPTEAELIDELPLITAFFE